MARHFKIYLIDVSPKPFRNFARPFTAQTWIGSARKFVKMRFGRFPTFYFSTPKKVFRRNFRIEKSVVKDFREVLGDAQPNGNHHQLRLQILL